MEADIFIWQKPGHFYFALTLPICHSRFVAIVAKPDNWFFDDFTSTVSAFTRHVTDMLDLTLWMKNV